MIESLSQPEKDAILAAIYARRKIEAIKLVRKATGSELVDAKQFVERYSDELEAKEPEKFAPKSSAKGCSAAVVMLMVLAAVIVAVGILAAK